MSLPLDPHDFPGTPEYEEVLEERAHRAHILAEAAMEELEETHAFRRRFTR